MTLLIVAVTLLTMMGIVMVFSASIIELADDEQNPYTELVSQLIFVGDWPDRGDRAGARPLSLLAGQGDLRAVGRHAAAACRRLGGRHRLPRRHALAQPGGVGLQPSEFAKITIIMVGARIMAEHVEGGMGWKRFALLFGFGVLLPFGLILSQNDLGTLIILAATLICMMMLAEYPLRWIAIVRRAGGGRGDRPGLHRKLSLEPLHRMARRPARHVKPRRLLRRHPADPPQPVRLCLGGLFRRGPG